MYAFILSLDLSWQQSEKLIQELAWRDYWQQLWIARGEDINRDLKRPQEQVANRQIPQAIIKACTGIKAIDQAISELYATGYMHNHMRMYVASICCNVSRSHWLEPSRWMYAHLLDGDLASNQLSWQWVAGTNSSKKYYANQDNINKFFSSSQKNTFLDVAYDEFSELGIPTVLSETVSFDLLTTFPEMEKADLDNNTTTLIYNYYNIDPAWHKGEDVQRILLLEPSLFNKNPVKAKNIDFVLNLSHNIPGIKIVVGEFSELRKQIDPNKIIYKEHPLNKHYTGREEPREWLSSVSGYFPSFFAFWKKCKKELNNEKKKSSNKIMPHMP